MGMGEAMGIVPTYDINENRNGDMMGGGGSWVWIILFVLLLGGNGGGGLFGGNRDSAAIAQGQISNEFLFSNLNHSIDTVGTAVNTGFTATANGLCNLGYENMSNFKDLQAQLSACCCETNRNIDAVRYEAAKNTCEIITAGDKNTDRIIAHLTATEMQNLRDSLQTANLQLSQQAQSANLINELRPCPIPAYPACSPYEALGLNGHCGC